MNKIVCALFAAVQLSSAQPGVPIIFPFDPVAQGPPAPMVCNIPCQSGAPCTSPCAQKTGLEAINIENPTKSWSLSCSAQASCFGSEFNINYGPNGMTKFLDHITISSPFAAYGAHITINNQQTAESVKVIKIECGAGNCAGATFEFIGADFGDLKCEEYGGCGAGCQVIQHNNAVNCDLVSTT